jgi:hypothetical protein
MLLNSFNIKIIKEVYIMSSPVISDINLDDITFKKPEKLSKNLIIIPITYQHNKRFIIQTPKLVIPEIPIIYCHRKMKFYKLKLCAFNYSFEQYIKDYVDKIQKIDALIKEKSKYFIKKYKIINKLENFVPSYYFNKEKTVANFYVNLQMLRNKPAISIFDWEKNSKDMNYIMPQSMSYSIIWLQNIWFKDNKVGLNWVILQMKVYLPIYQIEKCLIVDDLENIVDQLEQNKIKGNPNTELLNDENTREKNLPSKSGIKLMDHPIYSKYFNMKRFKIPIPAIQMKLKMNNLDPNIILKDENDIYEDNVDKNDVTVTISKNLFNNVKLKKSKPIKRIKNSGPVVSQNGMRPPSLDEILNMKNALTKTGKNLC